MTALGSAAGARVHHATGRPAVLLDTLYLVAVIVAVVVGGATQLALAVPVAGVLGLRAVRRRRIRHPGC